MRLTITAVVFDGAGAALFAWAGGGVEEEAEGRGDDADDAGGGAEVEDEGRGDEADDAGGARFAEGSEAGRGWGVGGEGSKESSTLLWNQRRLILSIVHA